MNDINSLFLLVIGVEFYSNPGKSNVKLPRGVDFNHFPGGCKSQNNVYIGLNTLSWNRVLDSAPYLSSAMMGLGLGRGWVEDCNPNRWPRKGGMETTLH